MNRVALLSVLLAAALAAVAIAQDKAPAKAEAPRAKVVDVSELSLAEGEALKVEDNQRLFPIEGRPKGSFYLVVKLSRELPEKASADVTGLDIGLLYGTAPAVLPSAVAAMKRDVPDGQAAYPASDKKRWVSEVYFFPVTRGQREWTVSVKGQSLGSVAGFYATLIVRNADDVTSRMALPDGSTPTWGGNQVQKFQFPAGTCNLVLEVRGKGKVEVPWTKFDKGDVKYLAVVGDVRNGPLLPADSLRKALPKINKAWQMFHKQKGVGGGAYNIATPTAPVHVVIDFGTEGAPGGITRCEVDRIEVTFQAEPPGGKSKSKAKDEPRWIKVDEMYNSAWKIQPWEKAELVEITEDARKVVGEAQVGRFVIRSTASAPSFWATDGLLEKGLVFEKDHGTFKVEAKKQGEMIVVWGVQTK